MFPTSMITPTLAKVDCVLQHKIRYGFKLNNERRVQLAGVLDQFLNTIKTCQWVFAASKNVCVCVCVCVCVDPSLALGVGYVAKTNRLLRMSKVVCRQSLFDNLDSKFC